MCLQQAGLTPKAMHRLSLIPEPIISVLETMITSYEEHSNTFVHDVFIPTWEKRLDQKDHSKATINFGLGQWHVVFEDSAD